MIFTLPLTLASEFVTHILSVVLTGVVIVEYVTKVHACQKNSQLATYVRGVRWIVLLTALAVGWFIAEYFFINDGLWYRVLLRWPMVMVILLLFRAFCRRHRETVHKKVSGAFIFLLGLFLLLDILDFFTGMMPIVSFFLALDRITAMIAFYFSFLYYFIRNDPQPESSGHV